MGGGDLNLKKSWHPNTMKNMERVWKAEQKDTEEKKRIAELQREINAERDREDIQKFAEDTGVVKKKDDLKLEWMYKGPSQSVNREEYLLGKAIDKSFEKYNSEQNGGPSAFQDEERLPGSIREAKSSLLNDQVDMARKMNEDPLMAIRQRAVQKAKELYNNPVRLKQMQKMVASKSEEKKDKKKKKKSKKSSKKDEDKMLDALLTERLKNALKDRDVLRKLKKKARKERSDSSSSGSSAASVDDENHADPRQKRHTGDIQSNDREHHRRSCSPSDSNDKRKKFTSNSYDHRDARRKSRSPRPSKSHDKTSRRQSRSRSRERERYSHHKDQQLKHYDSKEGKMNRRCGSPETSRHRKRVSSPEKRNTYKDRLASPPSEDRRGDKGIKVRRERSRSNSSDDSDNDRRKKKISYGLVMPDGSKPVKLNNPVVQEVKPAASQPKPNPWQRKERVKLTDEEKERRRREMMDNASWRDREREENVRRYRSEEEREKKQHQEDFDDDFARKQFSKATATASVEGRIKSKLNTIQRSKMAMDSNFARR